MMNAHQVKLVQQSFEKVAALGLPAIELFYSELFTIDPSLRAMFRGDLRDQQKKLLAALSVVVRSLHAPEKIVEPVQKLAVKHVSYGVAPEHYTYVGNALLRTLTKGLGTDFTPELRAAWVEAYRTLSGIMKSAAYDGRASELRGVA